MRTRSAGPGRVHGAWTYPTMSPAAPRVWPAPDSAAGVFRGTPRAYSGTARTGFLTKMRQSKTAWPGARRARTHGEGPWVDTRQRPESAVCRAGGEPALLVSVPVRGSSQSTFGQDKRLQGV